MARRDEDALRELYRRYAPFLTAMIQRMDSDANAQTLVEEAFVRFWDGARRFDPVKASARTWIVTAAHRLAVNRLSRGSRGDGPISIDGSAQGPAAGTGTGTETDGVYVSEALDRLDPLARQLLEIAFFGGRDHHQLVELSGRPPATVKTTLRRALASLHDAVAGGER